MLGEQNPDEDEFINLEKYKVVGDALKLLDDNTITDSKTTLALMYLKQGKWNSIWVYIMI